MSNTASGNQASVSGGMSNTASGNQASVTGGAGNSSIDLDTAVDGGCGNTAGGSATTPPRVPEVCDNGNNGGYEAILGGAENLASNDGGASGATVSGGIGNVSDDQESSVLGGFQITVNTGCSTFPTPSPAQDC
jgi:hypothetical protein